MRDANLKTRDNAHAVLNIAVNYGGRSEIVDAIRAMARAGADLRTLDEAAVSDFLYTQGLPDPDLIIRTAGEMRLSNFLLWQSAYGSSTARPPSGRTSARPTWNRRWWRTRAGYADLALDRRRRGPIAPAGS